MRECKLLSLIIPVYNEEEVLNQSYQRMREVLAALPCDFEMVYVDDGSRDRSWELLQELAREDRHVRALRFARNFGHQLAVTAGMDAACGDVLVIIDVDLQDPPEVIPEMLERWAEGYDVVYGKRISRAGESAFKKATASLYYRFLRRMSAYEIPLDTGDFRLIDRKVADVMGSMPEHNRFLRGMSAWAGFSQCPVEYERHSRAAGQTHYSLKKMVRLAFDGMMGFSDKPLLMPLYLGVLLLGLCLLALIIFIVLTMKGVLAPWLWALWVVLLLFGLVFLTMGLQGAYISQMMDEARRRPLYILREEIGEKRDAAGRASAAPGRSEK